MLLLLSVTVVAWVSRLSVKPFFFPDLVPVNSGWSIVSFDVACLSSFNAICVGQPFLFLLSLPPANFFFRFIYMSVERFFFFLSRFSSVCQPFFYISFKFCQSNVFVFLITLPSPVNFSS